MANMFDENGNYNKTEWKPGDRITAGKLNKIEESLEAINNNDIERHKEADERLDALEEQNEAVNDRFDELEDLVADNKSEVDTAIYEVHSKMDRLEQELNEGIEEVHNVAETVDGKITSADASMKAQVNQGKADMEAIAHTVDDKIAEADASMKAQVAEAEDIVDQGKADINAIIDEVEKISDLEAINTQLTHIVEYECNNKNFLNNIGNNRTLILTEDINVSKLDLFDISNLTITSKNCKRTINITGKAYWDAIVMKNCENIAFDNIKIKHDYCESSSIFIHSLCSNITINNCYITSKMNGIGTGEWLDSTTDNMIKDITISNNTFKVGRMCIEIMNRGDVVRCKNIKILKNKFEWGSATERPQGELLAVSLVGKQEGNIIKNNIFDSSIYGFWGIEICCGIGTLIEGNIFMGKALYSIHFTITSIDNVNIPSYGCVISNNICIQHDSSTLSVVLKEVNNSIVKGNRIGTLRVTNNSSYNLISDNNILSNSISGVIEFGGSSRRNKSSNNILRCTNADQACRGIFVSGEGTKENTSTNDTVILPSTATKELYFQELSPAVNNNSEMVKGYLE